MCSLSSRSPGLIRGEPLSLEYVRTRTEPADLADRGRLWAVRRTADLSHAWRRCRCSLWLSASGPARGLQATSHECGTGYRFDRQATTMSGDGNSARRLARGEELVAEEEEVEQRDQQEVDDQGDQPQQDDQDDDGSSQSTV